MTADMELEWVDVGELTLFPGNARRGVVEKIRESIRENGFFDPLTVQRSTGHIITGNHSYRAALDEGMTKVPVVWQDVTDARALKMNIAHNKLSDDATYDVDDLIDQLQTVDDLDGTGWTEAELAELLADDAADDEDDEDLGAEKTPQAVQCPQCAHEFDPNLNRV
jgi:ParB-like chromosome segregation protein Spo0J